MELLNLAIFGLLTISVGVGIIYLSGILGPKRGLAEKLDPYECGVPLISSSREKFNVHFYMVAIAFMLFDIETIFLIPWALHYNLLGNTALISVVIFVLVLAVGWVYIIRRGVLEWDKD